MTPGARGGVGTGGHLPDGPAGSRRSGDGRPGGGSGDRPDAGGRWKAEGVPTASGQAAREEGRAAGRKTAGRRKAVRRAGFGS